LKGATSHIRQLEKIMRLSDVRRAGIAALLLEVWFLWSFHVAIAFQRWRAQSRRQVRAWFEALGELEAVASLATLAHDHPSWCFPEIDDGRRTIEAHGIGHPMIPEGKRVHNDVTIGPPGTLLLITGSNMSGKSTLLRSIGVNTVLAHAGAPVCARTYRSPLLQTYASVNVRDSVAEGVSLYMAQLQRIKHIVDAATAAAAPRLTLYLLDEILSGTNSEDRTAGVAAVVRHLLRTSSIGVLATHDLALIDDPHIKAAAHFIHFADTITTAESGDNKMLFDYRIRRGPVRSSNAMALMRMLGLPVE
jgi:DNA mismatch repair ATPase MutS